ncbi:hypothetical protein [Salmonella enterica]|uniref:hypothetical protein n=1 Tax=Salmonella enterica TaxID=28901 RepID=UPI0009AC5E03|nr:hypothetical protein [Salmonella enterica]
MQRKIRFLVLKSFYDRFNQISQKNGHQVISYVRLDDARIGEEKKYSRDLYDSYRITFDSDDVEESFLQKLKYHVEIKQISEFEFVVG